MAQQPFILNLSHRSITLIPMISVLLLVPACSSSTSSSTGTSSSTEANADGKSVNQKPKIVIPDGTSQQIFEFISNVENERPLKQSRQQRMDRQLLVERTKVAGAGKILDQETDDETLKKAVEMKTNSLMRLAMSRIPGAIPEMMAEFQQLKESSKPVVAEVALKKLRAAETIATLDLDQYARKAFADKLLEEADQRQFDEDITSVVYLLGNVLESIDDTKGMVALYIQAADLAQKHSTPRHQSISERFRVIARNLDMPGNFLKIEAVKVDGQPFDWASYRGKVVLVDFWATWCGPCLAEMPYVFDCYQKFHDRGFDVVGVSLDRRIEPLVQFLKDRNIPWVTLYDEKVQNGKKATHPLAAYYGIGSIPTAILVDREGKVISTMVRGGNLERLVTEALAKP